MPRRKRNVAPFVEIKRTGPTDQVREQLLAAIERGDYSPGDKLPSERILQEQFGVSRVSVREAIAGLEAVGLIVVEHGRGAFVRGWSGEKYANAFAKYLDLHRDELLELFKVRGALDELAASEAAQKRGGGSAREISSAHHRFELAAKAEEEATHLAALDVAFHVSIANAATGLLLSELVRDLNGVLEESRLLSLAQPGRPIASAREHKEILDAIVAGDVKRATTAVREHMASNLRWLSTRGIVLDQDE